MLTCNAVYTDVSLMLMTRMQNVAKHKGIIDPSDLKLMFQVFRYENYSKNPTILIKKILFDLMQLSVLRGGVSVEKLKLNDFKYREETNDDGEISKFFVNENFLAHSKGKRREVGKIKSFLPCITIKYDDTETCEGIKLLYANCYVTSSPKI